DLTGMNRNVHQDRDQGGCFYSGVPTVDVMRGVGFGDAEFLRLLQGIVKAQALFHLAEDHVGGGVQNSVKALQVDGGELVEERKDGDAIHHRGFEEKAFALAGSEIAEFAVGVNDRAFVRGDRVGSVVERGADVRNGGLTAFHV